MSDTGVPVNVPVDKLMPKPTGGFVLMLSAVWMQWFNRVASFMQNIVATTASLSSYVRPGTPAGAAQTACGLYAGTGAPSNSNGNNGDIYFRSDGGTGTTIYQKRTGAWVGVA